MRKRYDYKWGQYVRNMRDTGASRVGNVGFVLSVLLGIGLACFLALGPLVLGWPGRWAMAVMTAALLTGAGMCWVGKRSGWSFLLFF